jgi:hypothetical protein
MSWDAVSERDLIADMRASFERLEMMVAELHRSPSG